MRRLITFQIFVPLNSLLHNISDVAQAYQEGIAELSEMDHILFALPNVGETACKISHVKQYISKVDKYAIKCEALVFTIKLPIQKSERIFYDKKGQRNTKTINNFIINTAEEFEIQVTNFFLFLQIAKPLAFKTRKGDLFINKVLFQHFDEIISIHQESFEDIQVLKWPVYKSLKFKKVLDWSQKYQLSFDNIAQTKLGIALNAYSYLFEYNTSYTLDLLWSLIGIESLYCSSKDGIADQIFERSQLVLGPITDFKKRLKSMYNFRSRFIHGDLMISSSIAQSFITEEVENFSEEFYQASILAIAILTASLQKMVEMDKSELSFKTVLV